jgi:hypothetical protein
MNTSGTTLLSECLSYAPPQVDVKGRSKTGRTRKTSRSSTICPWTVSTASRRDMMVLTSSTSHSIGTVGHLNTISTGTRATELRHELTLTRGIPSRGTGTVCHISSPLSNLIFSSLLNCSRRASGSSSALTSVFPATAGIVSESIVLDIGKGVGISVLTGILSVCLIIVHWCDILTSVKYRRDDSAYCPGRPPGHGPSG